MPEIGPVKAQAIIDGRPYKKTEDVMKVKGFKEQEFAKIKEFGLSLGFGHVESGPLVRSSYHADEQIPKPR